MSQSRTVSVVMDNNVATKVPNSKSQISDVSSSGECAHGIF